MNKISPREIQTFVAGAFALPAFRCLVWLPYYITPSWHGAFTIVVSCLALLLGIGVFIGSAQALRWAQIFLWVCLLGAVINVCLSIFERFGLFPQAPQMRFYPTLSDFLVVVILLSLLLWSRSKRVMI
jgi:hypothetical protein